jgi:hypothetical protein
MRGQYAIALEIADRHHGRARREDLLLAGIDAKRIQRWLADGRLRLVHRGVYAVGHAAPSVLGDYMAAVLAGGNGASLSHAPVVHVLRLLPGGQAPPPEITVPTTAHRRRPGIVIHRVEAVHDYDRDAFRGIPITSIPRTLLDMAPRLGPAQLARACHEAWVRHSVTPRHVDACIARNPGKPGGAKLQAALGSDVTLSKLEDAFLALLAGHGLPRPRTNVDHRGDKVDCHWPRLGLTVELVSYRFHASRRAFEADVARRRRSNHLAFTWGDVFERSPQTIAELSRAIYAAAAC